MSQQTLFEVEKQIPQWLADYFELANAGNYRYKQDFYDHIKPVILKNFATPAGVDLQIIEKECWSCNGTGVYKKYQYEYGQRYLLSEQACFKCDKGIFDIKQVYLSRWILNGKVYHMPADKPLYTPVTNEIKGIIKHEPVDNQAAGLL